MKTIKIILNHRSLRKGHFTAALGQERATKQTLDTFQKSANYAVMKKVTIGESYRCGCARGMAVLRPAEAYQNKRVKELAADKHTQGDSYGAFSVAYRQGFARGKILGKVSTGASRLTLYLSFMHPNQKKIFLDYLVPTYYYDDESECLLTYCTNPLR